MAYFLKRASFYLFSQTCLNAYWLLSKVKGIAEHVLVEVTLRDKKILISNMPSHCSGLFEFGK